MLSSGVRSAGATRRGTRPRRPVPAGFLGDPSPLASAKPEYARVTSHLNVLWSMHAGRHDCLWVTEQGLGRGRGGGASAKQPRAEVFPGRGKSQIRFPPVGPGRAAVRDTLSQGPPRRWGPSLSASSRFSTRTPTARAGLGTKPALCPCPGRAWLQLCALRASLASRSSPGSLSRFKVNLKSMAPQGRATSDPRVRHGLVETLVLRGLGGGPAASRLLRSPPLASIPSSSRQAAGAQRAGGSFQSQCGARPTPVTANLGSRTESQDGQVLLFWTFPHRAVEQDAEAQLSPGHERVQPPHPPDL